MTNKKPSWILAKAPCFSSVAKTKQGAFFQLAVSKY
jgi:hypothetical protein